MRTSYSALATFKQCPRRYKFKILEGIKEPKTKEQIFGTFIHDCLRYMFSRDPLFPTLDQVIEYYHLNFPQEAWDDAAREIYEAEGEKMLRKFYQKNAPWNFAVLDLESRFEVTLEDKETSQTHILAGIIDRIDKLPDETYEIIDYKTQKRLPSQAQVDRDLQLSIYAMGLKKRWPHVSAEKIKLSLQFLKHGEKLSTKRRDEDFEKTESDIIGTINDIEKRTRLNREFEPVVTPLCDFCGYKSICPAWKHLYKNVKSEAVAGNKIPDIMHEYFQLREAKQKSELRLKELTVLLTRYLGQEQIERIFGEDGVVSKRTIEKYVYDFEKIQSILEPLGKWQAILGADEKKLRRILKEIPDGAREEIKNARTLAKTSVTLAATRKKRLRAGPPID